MSESARFPARSAPSRGDWLMLAFFAGGCLVLGNLSALTMGDSQQTWYPALTRWALTPPDWVFPVAWSILYPLMGLAAWLVWRRRRLAVARPALTLFAIQLVLNLTWTPAFFGLRSVLLGFVVIVAVLVAVVATTFAFWRVSRAAGLVFVPYLAWVTFATVVAYQTWQLNPS